MSSRPPTMPCPQGGVPPGEECPPAALEEILSFLRKALPQRPAASRVAALQGDASDRRYFRIWFADPSAGEPASCVLMKLASPWVQEGRQVDLAFVDVARHLAEKGLPVPGIYVDASREGFVLLEDVGDLTLQHYLGSCSARERKARYEEALQILVRMQRDASSPSSRPCHALEYAFETDTFFRELGFFMEHAVEGLWRRRIHPSDRQELEGSFRDLCRRIAGYPRVFTHRDYHSRNLMIHQGRIVMLDFQDARLGPLTYDLASLVLDSYVVVEPAEQDALLACYRDACGRAGLVCDEPEAFRAAFALTGLQRNLKAIGTFAYQATVRKVDRYLPFIPNTVRSVRRALERDPDLAGMKRVLETYVGGLR